ncbi:hypothetical protein ACNR9Q_01510 [Maribacter sp. X9]|uniref:hypothetical protein n=1 Tax=Maribacter sp. X9 TaxID=3402159 RepID=UPI003AF3B944
MKKLSAFLIVVFCIISCSNPDDFGLESTEFMYSTQKWELIRMTGAFVGSETKGEAMDWQEYYLFSPEGTFVKSRTKDDLVVEASGTFEVVEYETDTAHSLELTYETGEGLVGNCTGDNKEILMYRSASEITNTWMACDGPGLDYELVKN